MPKDKDFKRLVRERMAETGERYMKARAEVLGPPRVVPAPVGDWKEQHIRNADRMPLAVWRAFAAPDGEPLDIRQRFFSEPVDDDDARRREDRLREEVIRWLDDTRRVPFMTSTAPRPEAVPGLEMHVHEDFLGRRMGFMGGAHENAFQLPITLLAARALTQLTGEVHEPLDLMARYRAAVNEDQTVTTTLDVKNHSVPVADIRFAVAEKLRYHPAFPRPAHALEAGVYPDGKVSLVTLMSPPRTPTEPTLPQDALIAAALTDLTD